MSTTTLMTVEQFVSLPEDEHSKYELVEGELVPVSSPIPRHNVARDRILILVARFLWPNQHGQMLSETDIRIGDRTVRRPDLAYIRHEKWKQVDLGRIPISVMPDLVVEVLSESDTMPDFNHKVNEYFAAGVAEVWLVFPDDREIHVRTNALIRIVRAGDTLESPTLIPGLSIPVSEIFEGL